MTGFRRVVKAMMLSLLALVVCASSFAATVSSRKYSRTQKQKVAENASAQKRISHARHSRSVARTATTQRTTATPSATRRASQRRYVERFHTSSFAEGQRLDDVTGGEDPIVRAAAIDALGNMNGTVVAIDPNSGRILAMVNQKLALSQRRRALLHHQGRRRPGGAQREHRHEGDAGPARRRLAYQHDPGPGPLQQRLLRGAGPPSRL